MERRHIAGLSAAVVRGDQIWTMHAGYANVAERRPVDVSTRFHVASITEEKLFTTTALLQLCDRGLVAIDDPMKLYLPELEPLLGAHEAHPTFRQAVTHTTGLCKDFPFDYWAVRGPILTFPEIDALLASLSPSARLFPPSVAFHYSNVGFALCGRALEIASGMLFEPYLRQHVWQPLEMLSTSCWSPDIAGSVATSYIASRGQLREGPVIHHNGMRYTGGAISTATDLARFVMAQFSNDFTILKPEVIRESHRAAFTTAGRGASIGLGWHLETLDGQHIVGHSGDLPGWACCLKTAPDLQLGVVLLSNTGGNVDDLCTNMLSRAIRIGTSDSSEAGGGCAAAALQRYVGTYTDDFDTVDVEALGGRLAMLWDGTPDDCIFLDAEDEGTFRVRNGFATRETMTFQVGPDNLARSLALQGRVLTKV
jgi:CubicO group peptidase (beta-lactamase class C family)